MSYLYHLLHARQLKWKNLAILHMVIAQKEFTTLKKEASTEHTRKKLPPTTRGKKISLLPSKFSYIKVKQKQEYYPLIY